MKITSDEMDNDSKPVFETYIVRTFPLDGKHTTSAIIREALVRSIIISYLKGGEENGRTDS